MYTAFHLIPKPEREPSLYHFAPFGSAHYKVNEQGSIHFPSGKKLTLYNDYETSIHYSRTNMQLTLRTDSKGTFDPALEILKPHHNVLVTINRHPDEQDFCPHSISPLYPLSLRRLLYILPTDLKPNQHIRRKVCSRYNCQWKSEEINDTLHIEIYCEATTENHLSVIFSTTLLFTQNAPFYAVAHGNISVESPDISSTWQFSEFLNQPNHYKEIKNAKKIHAN